MELFFDIETVFTLIWLKLYLHLFFDIETVFTIVWYGIFLTFNCV